MFDKTYNPIEIEKKLSETWKTQNIGRPGGSGSPYCIMVPPPNVTGSLHLGHALQLSVMDTLSRYRRAMGEQVLLQPGTDHAGIATQMVVERKLAAQGISKHDLGREAFIDKIWEWKAQSGGTITQQTRQLGVTVDWESERFTMDDQFSDSVKHTFIKLYNDGYIYRGKRLVNWDTVLNTAVSDLEVANTEKQGQIWYISYPVGDDSITVATTRPETMLGDMAICVHPEDERYQTLIGQMATLPLCNREIPIIADDTVDPEFGTGCVKITPAHDFNDYEIGQRHNLTLLNILNSDGTLNTECPEAYQGLDRFVARKKIVSDLEALGLLVKIEPHTSIVPIGDRSNTVLEPYLTDQWYVKTDKLAKAALSKLDSGEISFIPDMWEKNYRMWLEDIQDWCISRQLWWGHRIPAYYDEAGNSYVGENEENIRKTHNIQGELRQDEDVLDTWFSSALWPFATLGWPDSHDKLDTFYPNSLLVTGFDIIFFWVARMTMFGEYFTQKMPFPKVFVTGLIRDEFGQKMSKSKGNVLDPTDLILGASLDDLITKRTTGMMQPKMKEAAIKATQKSFPEGIEPHGTDALRFTLLSLLTHTKDINFDLNKLRSSRNFCNKIWNAARFLSQEAQSGEIENTITSALTHQIRTLLIDCDQHLSDYRFDRYAQTLYEFFWYEFCDWHLELAKVDTVDAKSGHRMAHLYEVFDTILIIMHPALPFITEALWQHKHGEDNILAKAAMPKPEVFPEQQQDYELYCELKTLISGIRNIRSELNVPPKATLELYVLKDEKGLLKQFSAEVMKLAGIQKINTCDTIPTQCCAYVNPNINIGIDLSGHIDKDQEKARLSKRIEKLTKELNKIKQKTANPNYQEKAPLALKQKDQAASNKLLSDISQLEGYLAILS